MYELDTWDPKIYSECSGLQYNAALKFLDGFHFNRKEDILDIGCGDGKITEYLALNTQGLVMGIDKSSYDYLCK